MKQAAEGHLIVFLISMHAGNSVISGMGELVHVCVCVWNGHDIM